MPIIHSEEQIAGEVALLHDPPAHADDDPRVGVPAERVDARTLEVIRLLFNEKGLLFLAVLLQQARAKQRALPDLGVVECAVITARTIRELATRISQPGASWSYDTTEKYLVIFCALGLLSKGKSPDGIEYFFPLQPYTPPATFDALDAVIRSYRKKVQSFGNRVKRRFVVYLAQQPSPVSPLPVPVGPPFDLPGAEEDIGQIVQEELGTGALQERLLLKIRGTLRYRCRQSSLQHVDASACATDPSRSLIPFQTDGETLARTENGRLSIQSGNSLPAISDAALNGKSPVGEETGDFLQTTSKSGQLSSPTGDFLLGDGEVTAVRESPISCQTGDFSQTAAPKSRLRGKMGDFTAPELRGTALGKSPVSEQTGDSEGSVPPKNGRLSAQGGDLAGQKGDFSPQEITHVNVIAVLTTLTSNVRIVALFCCRIFNEPGEKWPIYRKLFQQVDNDIQAIAAALLFTLAHRDDGTMRNPPAVFMQRCRDFHQTPPPDAECFAEATRLVDQYGQLPYRQLVHAFAVKQDQTVQMQAWKPGPAHQMPPMLKPLASSLPRQLSVRLPLASGGGMTWGVAQHLREQIAHDRRFGLCRVGIVTLTDSSYAVLIDKSERKVRQYVFYAVQEWQERSPRLQSCYELFDGVTPQRAPLLGKGGEER